MLILFFFVSNKSTYNVHYGTEIVLHIHYNLLVLIFVNLFPFFSFLSIGIYTNGYCIFFTQLICMKIKKNFMEGSQTLAFKIENSIIQHSLQAHNFLKSFCGQYEKKCFFFSFVSDQYSEFVITSTQNLKMCNRVALLNYINILKKYHLFSDHFLFYNTQCRNVKDQSYFSGWTIHLNKHRATQKRNQRNMTENVIFFAALDKVNF